ncbi:MAG: DUF1501 domain-containing protein [Planctomycetia bacterium]
MSGVSDGFSPASGCGPVSAGRRDFLHVGALSALGLSLGGYLRGQAARADAKSFAHFEGKAKSVIHIWLPGGWAQQETFDPKPLSPSEYRGEMKSIDTKLPGVQFNELLGKTAEIADKITVVRSMTHGEAAHERGTHNMFPGYRPSPALTFPSFGSVVSHEFGPPGPAGSRPATAPVPRGHRRGGNPGDRRKPGRSRSPPKSRQTRPTWKALPGVKELERKSTRRVTGESTIPVAGRVSK